jgi:hypothetical protein
MDGELQRCSSWRDSLGIEIENLLLVMVCCTFEIELRLPSILKNFLSIEQEVEDLLYKMVNLPTAPTAVHR